MRKAKCMREMHKQHYACALKIASEQRPTDFKPSISWFVAQPPWGAGSFPYLPTSGAGGKRTLYASCKQATTHVPVIKLIAPDAR